MHVHVVRRPIKFGAQCSNGCWIPSTFSGGGGISEDRVRADTRVVLQIVTALQTQKAPSAVAFLDPRALNNPQRHLSLMLHGIPYEPRIQGKAHQ